MSRRVPRKILALLSPPRPNEWLLDDPVAKMAGLDLVKEFEGYFPKAAPCPEGVPTAGWGHTGRDVETGKTYSREQCEAWLAADMAEHGQAVVDAIRVPLTPNQFAALRMFSFNVGAGWLTGKGHQQASFVRLLNAGDYACVPAQLLRFTRGANTGKRYNGLYRRRVAEGALWNDAGSVAAVREPVEPSVQASTQDALPVTLHKSRTILGVIYAGCGAILASLGDLATVLPAVRDQADAIGGPLGQLLRTIGATVPPHFGLIVVAVGLIVVLHARITAAHEGKIG